MRFIVRMLVFAVIAGLPLAGPAYAQSSSSRPNSGDVAQQFNSGANRVGHGAAEIGQGIKHGAIMTWQALRDGANAVARRFDNDGGGYRRNSRRDHARPTQQQR